MQIQIIVDYKYTNNLYTANQWLCALPDVIACDFETASRFSQQEKELMRYRLDNFNLPFEKQRILFQQLTSDGLSHPSLSVITHLSIAWTNHNAIVIVCDTSSMRKLVYEFLTTTQRHQIWHNAPFDHKHIHYNTNKWVLDFEDTFLESKCLLNDANSMNDKVGLKVLMGYAYGKWALAKDKEKGDSSFTLENMWNKTILEYAAIDSCATFKLKEDLVEESQKWKM